MSTATQSPKSLPKTLPTPEPITDRAAAAAPKVDLLAQAEDNPGDRLAFSIWIGGAALILAMNVWDFIIGLCGW